MSITLEEGKYYRTRDGDFLGPYTAFEGSNDIMWVKGDYDTSRYTNGRMNVDYERGGDLISECVSVSDTADAIAYTFSGFDPAATPDIKTTIADEAKRIVSGARRSAYGKPEDNFERIARLWQAHFANTGRAEAAVTAGDISVLMVLMKIGRIAESPAHYDSWVDVVGYALTGAEVNGVKAGA
jgi:hypothetical protein